LRDRDADVCAVDGETLKTYAAGAEHAVVAVRSSVQADRRYDWLS
jgi:hypothetical protein